MTRRIAIWATVGFLIAGFWAVYYSVRGPVPVTSTERLLAPFARITCPIVLLGDHFGFGVSIYWSILANIATYALFGLIWETLRRQVSSAR